eukprot:Protomagalhaensia_sp_Gyna_25__2802@NODE_261_length_4139_cov_1927_910488_g202_i0_p2_GENE_NODE_261_length_4139_cov_1927_910488_g202_i0NODE_261_length_4139_cov_1927_910488_g202_i0_p2_ORF_typecomplete_len329_score54_86YrhK/PF14145_6/5_1YrhK/PF14145_6/3_2YrhK/PF14145_6/5_5e06DUF872/PF05915_12/1_3e02DUF872/PF05915_12/0_32DUF872/PF05915_12/2_4e02ImpYgjV/PF10688_9/0_13ImpYgjV/PF10688_9/1_2e02ImpYgjV/PF10688_9/1e03_NODE_261_length_4139_cov_1927_910488_g202_i017302716
MTQPQQLELISTARREILIEEEENGMRRVKEQKPRWWFLEVATRQDRHVMMRCGLNLLGALGFLIGSVGWVANFMMVGTFIFAGANCFYETTGIWWAISTRKALAQRVRLRGTILLNELGDDEEDQGLALQPLGLIESVVPTGTNPDELWPRTEVTRAFSQVARVEVLAALLQICGAVGFTVGCFCSLNQNIAFETNFLYLMGSALFLGQGVICQLICGSFWGPLLPVWPKFHRLWSPPNRTAFSQLEPSCCRHSPICLHRLIPGAMLNSLGSFLFVIASFALFYPELANLGGWGYVYGSCCFLVATLADLNGYLDVLAARYAKRVKA